MLNQWLGTVVTVLRGNIQLWTIADDSELEDRPHPHMSNVDVSTDTYPLRSSSPTLTPPAD